MSEECRVGLVVKKRGSVSELAREVAVRFASAHRELAAIAHRELAAMERAGLACSEAVGNTVFWPNPRPLPPTVLRGLRDAGQITAIEYQQALRGKLFR